MQTPKFSRHVSLFLAVCLLFGLLAVPAAAYQDVSSTDWFHDPVTHMTEMGLMDAAETDRFSPDQPATRAVLALALWRLAGQPQTESPAGFTDVPASDPARAAIDWAAEVGVVTGYSDTAFGPEDTLTRQQLAAILLRYAALFDFDSSDRDLLNRFTDAEDVAMWGRAGVMWCVAVGLLNGRGEHELQPNGTATRAELATILSRYCDQIVAPRSTGCSLTCDQTGGPIPRFTTSLSGAFSHAPGVGVKNLTYAVSPTGQTGEALLDRANGTWALPDVTLSGGETTVELTLTDLFGATATASLTFTYDPGALIDYAPDDVTYFGADSPMASADGQAGYVNNVLLVFLDWAASPDQQAAALAQVCASCGGQVVGSVSGALMYQIQVEKTDYDGILALCAQAETIPGVLTASCDFIAAVKTLPDDPWILSDNWDEDDPDGVNWWAEAVHLPTAWSLADHGSPIAIGMVDTGVDLNHEDITVDRTLAYNVPMAHGTHVAGILAADAGNGLGLTGVVWNRELLCCDVYQGADATTESHLIAGLARLIESGAKVINDSNAAVYTTLDAAAPSGRRAVSALWNLMHVVRDDFLLVMAAGNEGLDARYSGLFANVTPALAREVTGSAESAQAVLDHVLIAAACDRPEDGAYTLTEFSNYGPTVDLAAPGKSILSTIVKEDGTSSYGELSGTSMASPIVAGAAALVWQSRPELTPGQVKELLISTATTPVAPNPAHPEDTGAYYLLDTAAAIKKAAP